MKKVFCLTLLLTSIQLMGQETIVENQKGLKDYFQDYFPIGVAVSPRSLYGIDSALVVKEFNSVTAENIMKMGPIHPEEDEYNWKWADEMMTFAEKHQLKVRGHTLCWHNQTGRWLFNDAEGKTVSKDMLLDRLKDHIDQVAGRYKGKIYAWDVVNEVISDNPNEFYRPSEWYKISGKEFIAAAFRYAHEAVPDALLFYNDYNAIQKNKRDKIIQMIRELQSEGVPIGGMGIQAHWSIYGPSEQELREALDDYAQLGIDIQITELDISVYPSEPGRRDKRPDEADVFTPVMEAKQIAMYRMIFNVFRDYKDLITGVTFWNVSDAYSWKDNFPVRGRKNYPLLFDQERNRKKAYDAVVDFR